jgi:electron transport complex protein RnfD
VYLFGLHSLLVLIASVVSAAVTEVLTQLLLKKPVTASDGSAIITGLLLAMSLPPEIPAWMAVAGSVFSTLVVKQLFGGTGHTVLNPALAGRALLMALWPVQMTTMWHRFPSGGVFAPGMAKAAGLISPALDAVTQATPLGALREAPKLLADMNVPVSALHGMLFSKDMFASLFFGNTGGSIGETSALLLLAGAALLLARRIITWHIPAAFIGTAALFMLSYYSLAGFPFPLEVTLYHLLSGGLVLGALFMATDPFTTPLTGNGMLLFGAGCGILTCVIRLWGGYPEGAAYAILLMNCAVPLIHRFVPAGGFRREQPLEKTPAAP